jgi:hypothetical protein
MLSLLLCTLIGWASPVAEAPPGWLGDAIPLDPDDGLAQAPSEDSDAADHPVAPVPLDLSAVGAALEDGVRRILREEADPVEALPLPVTPAPETTAAELRGLLDGSGARDTRLAALSVQGVALQGEDTLLRFDATLLPGDPTALLRLTVPAPAPAGARVVLPGGLGVSWTRAEETLAAALRAGHCGGLPLVDDPVLPTLVPRPFLERTREARDAAGPAREALCAALAEPSWERLELRLTALHFNLYDGDSILRGGLVLRLDPEAPRLLYPLFKRLPIEEPEP